MSTTCREMIAIAVGVGSVLDGECGQEDEVQGEMTSFDFWKKYEIALILEMMYQFIPERFRGLGVAGGILRRGSKS